MCKCMCVFSLDSFSVEKPDRLREQTVSLVVWVRMLLFSRWQQVKESVRGVCGIIHNAVVFVNAV